MNKQVNLKSNNPQNFWFHELPPFWIVMLIVIYPPIFGTLYLYPSLSKDKLTKILQVLGLLIILFIFNYFYNQTLKFIFK
jgi:hypothetical protein